MRFPNLGHTTLLSKVLIAVGGIKGGQSDDLGGHEEQSKEAGPIVQAT